MSLESPVGWPLSFHRSWNTSPLWNPAPPSLLKTPCGCMQNTHPFGGRKEGGVEWCVCACAGCKGRLMNGTREREGRWREREEGGKRGGEEREREEGKGPSFLLSCAPFPSPLPPFSTLPPHPTANPVYIPSTHTHNTPSIPSLSGGCLRKLDAEEERGKGEKEGGGAGMKGQERGQRPRVTLPSNPYPSPLSNPNPSIKTPPGPPRPDQDRRGREGGPPVGVWAGLSGRGWSTPLGRYYPSPYIYPK